MLFFSYFAEEIYTLSKNLSSNFNLLSFFVGKRREAEERGEGTGGSGIWRTGVQ
jgi:hypothetical protein